MPKLSAKALKEKIAVLQKQLEAAEKNKAPAIKKVMALMKKLDVTLADLSGAQGETKTKGRRGRPPGKKSTAKAARNGKGARKPARTKGKVAIKYRDDQGNTWTGRGKTPRWLVEAEKTGKSREQFHI